MVEIEEISSSRFSTKKPTVTCSLFFYRIIVCVCVCQVVCSSSSGRIDLSLMTAFCVDMRAIRR